MSAYGTDESQLLGHLDVFKSEADWSSLTLCPPRYNNKVQDKYLSFSGTPNLAFTVQIDSSPLEIKLNEPKTVEVRPESGSVFQFIPTEDISNTQLDVTVTSESDEVPAYLKVSRDCKDVKENIDVVDYKGESIRLSFAKKGRITLSKVSIPPLTDASSSWFIGIAIKNTLGISISATATKNVTLELNRSFDYSYSTPITILVVVSTVLGFGVSFFANSCFKNVSTSKDREKELPPTLIQLEEGRQSQFNEQCIPKCSNLQGEERGLVRNVDMRMFEKSGVKSQYSTEGRETSSGASYREFPRLKGARTKYSTVPDIEASATRGKNRLVRDGRPFSRNAASRMHRQSPREMSSRRKLTEQIELLSEQEDNEQARRSMYGSTEESTDNVMQSTRTKADVPDRAISSTRSETGPLFSQQTQNICCLDALLHWFTRGPKTYSYITAIMGFALMLGAGQFVFANWHLMEQEGDRDNCYYNDFCYRVSPWHDIPFNLMISNLVYMLHGLILAVFVWYMEVKLLGKYRKRAERHSPHNHPLILSNHNDLPPKQAFSIGYAFAWALMFEGGFSLVYHLCPSKLTFQFDTAFMFVIAGLTVILLFNGIQMKKRSTDGKTAKSRVGAGNFFLYFMIPLYIFNYLGTLRHSQTGLSTLVEISFLVFLVCWWVIISIWAGYKLFSSPQHIQAEQCKKSLCFAVGVGLPIFCFLFWENLPQAFLLVCIAESGLIILFTCCRNGVKWKFSCLSFCHVLFVLLMGVVWGFALYFFWGRQTTDKVETPEKSRNLNQDCALLGFFDYHDIWHFLSSHALLMMVYFVMFMSSE